MPASRTSFVLPILIITVGLGWLLTAQNVIPGVNWVWVLGLGVAGVLVLAVGGLDRVTAVVGPFLIIATFFSILRQTGRITIDTEIPSLVILAGVLLLIARVAPLRPPRWLVDQPKNRGGEA